MILYELHAHQTDCYDRSSEIRTRLSDHGIGLPKVKKWMEGYFVLFPDGKVTVYRIIRRGQTSREQSQWIFTTTANDCVIT